MLTEDTIVLIERFISLLSESTKKRVPETSQMKMNLIQQMNAFPLGQTGRAAYVSNCIDAEMCPDCGSDIFVNEEVIDRELGKTIFFECSTCEWKNFNYAEHRL